MLGTSPIAVSEWTSREVVVWMRSTDLDDFASAAQRMQLSGAQLLLLNSSSIKLLGDADKSRRRKLLAAVAKLKKSAKRNKAGNKRGVTTGGAAGGAKAEEAPPAALPSVGQIPTPVTALAASGRGPADEDQPPPIPPRSSRVGGAPEIPSVGRDGKDDHDESPPPPPPRPSLHPPQGGRSPRASPVVHPSHPSLSPPPPSPPPRPSLAASTMDTAQDALPLPPAPPPTTTAAASAGSPTPRRAEHTGGSGSLGSPRAVVARSTRPGPVFAPPTAADCDPFPSAPVPPAQGETGAAAVGRSGGSGGKGDAGGGGSVIHPYHTPVSIQRPPAAGSELYAVAEQVVQQAPAGGSTGHPQHPTAAGEAVETRRVISGGMVTELYAVPEQSETTSTSTLPSSATAARVVDDRAAECALYSVPEQSERCDPVAPAPEHPHPRATGSATAAFARSLALAGLGDESSADSAGTDDDGCGYADPDPGPPPRSTLSRDPAPSDASKVLSHKLRAALAGLHGESTADGASPTDEPGRAETRGQGGADDRGEGAGEFEDSYVVIGATPDADGTDDDSEGWESWDSDSEGENEDGEAAGPAGVSPTRKRKPPVAPKPNRFRAGGGTQKRRHGFATAARLRQSARRKRPLAASVPALATGAPAAAAAPAVASTKEEVKEDVTEGEAEGEAAAPRRKRSLPRPPSSAGRRRSLPKTPSSSSIKSSGSIKSFGSIKSLDGAATFPGSASPKKKRSLPSTPSRSPEPRSSTLTAGAPLGSARDASRSLPGTLERGLSPAGKSRRPSPPPSQLKPKLDLLADGRDPSIRLSSAERDRIKRQREREAARLRREARLKKAAIAAAAAAVASSTDAPAATVAPTPAAAPSPPPKPTGSPMLAGSGRTGAQSRLEEPTWYDEKALREYEEGAAAAEAAAAAAGEASASPTESPPLPSAPPPHAAQHGEPGGTSIAVGHDYRVVGPAGGGVGQTISPVAQAALAARQSPSPGVGHDYRRTTPAVGHDYRLNAPIPSAPTPNDYRLDPRPEEQSDYAVALAVRQPPWHREKYYLGYYTRDMAEEALRRDGRQGCFMVRCSQKTPEPVLSFLFDGKVRHSRIRTHPSGKFYMGDATTLLFQTVEALVASHYCDGGTLKCIINQEC
eukprot:m.353713 g.353713  ORF g.353713 m.353713 type:complete len:1141 (+) comp16593_c2_seq24:245-3667(+)